MGHSACIDPLVGNLGSSAGEPFGPCSPRARLGWVSSEPRFHVWRRVTRLRPGSHSIARPSAWVPLGPPGLLSAWASQLPGLARGTDGPSLSCPGHVAALNMLHRQKPLHTVPFFWTKLQSKSIRYAGTAWEMEGGGWLDRTARRTRWKLRGPGRLPGLLGRSQTPPCSFSGYGTGHTETVPKGELCQERFLLFYLR